MAITYHGTPRDHFDSLDPTEPYLPAAFDADGFIHCTDGEDRLLGILTAYYRSEPGDWVVLLIETDRVASLVRYDDPERVFPHFYGPLNRDAIVEVRPLKRYADGSFVAIE